MNRQEETSTRTMLREESGMSDASLSNKETELLKYARCFTRLPRDPVSKKLRRPLYVTGALYRYTILFLLRSTVFTTSTIAFFSVLPLLISLSANKAGRTLCKLYCKALMFSLGIKLINHGPKPDLHTPHVFVANHTSFLDYIVLAGHKFPHACIMARHKGLIGWLQDGVMAFLNSTAFDRDDSEQRKAIKAKLNLQLQENPDCKLLIFPESTCVNNQYIVRFQKGVFDLDNHVRICPVAIRYGPETPRSTVFGHETAASHVHQHKTQRKKRLDRTTCHRSRAHQRRAFSGKLGARANEENYRRGGEDDHGWRKDLMHVSSAETTEGEEDEAGQNGWRKDLFRISDDDDDDEETHASDSDGTQVDHDMAQRSLQDGVPPAPTLSQNWDTVDPYWDTRQSLWQQLYYLMTRWKLETHVHYLPPQTRRQWREQSGDQTLGQQQQQLQHEEDPVDFANRIRCDIAQAAQLKVAEFNGRDKKQLLKMMDQEGTMSKGVPEALPAQVKRSPSARSVDEGYGSSLQLNSLDRTTSRQ